MQAWTCVVSTRSGPGVRTIGTGVEGRIVDALGVEFQGTFAVIQGASTTRNIVNYQTAVNNAWVDSRGWDTGSERFLTAAGDIGRFGIRAASTGDSNQYSIADYQADLFFGGNFQALGYVSAFRTGELDLTFASNARGPEDLILTVFAGVDVDFISGFANGAYSISVADPKILFALYGAYAPGGSPAATSTNVGGRDFTAGWDTYRNTRGAATYIVGTQDATHYRGYKTDRCVVLFSGTSLAASPATTVSAWAANSLTLANSASLNQNGFVLGGATIDANSGTLTQPTTAIQQIIDLGIKARWVRFMSPGVTAAANPSVDWAEMAIGETDGTRQGGFWAGEISDNVASPLGARYISDDSLIRFGQPNGASTSFHSVLRFVSLDASRRYMTVEWTVVDGTQRVVLWAAVGEPDTGTPTTKLLRADESSLGSDDDEPFQAYVLTKAFAPGGRIDTLGQTREAHVVGRVTDGAVELTVIRDMGKDSRPSDVTMAGSGSHVAQKFENSGAVDAHLVQFKLGDAAASEDLWSLDRLQVLRHDEGEA